jgi:hypothetical protein
LPVHVTSGRLAIVPVPARFAAFAMHVLPCWCSQRCLLVWRVRSGRLRRMPQFVVVEGMKWLEGREFVRRFIVGSPNSTNYRQCALEMTRDVSSFVDILVESLR